MTGIDIHVVTADDVADLVESVAGLFREDAGTHDPTMDTTWPARGGAEYYSGLIGTHDCLLTLARNGTATVGHLVGKLTPADDLRVVPFAVLESIRVDPAVRGEGVGSRLVEHFLAWARAAGAQRVSVSAYAANEGAQRFYRRHGFAPMTVTLRREL
jgi:ribosomal protein S18 acetylase RimI-like enzyme